MKAVLSFEMGQAESVIVEASGEERLVILLPSEKILSSIGNAREMSQKFQ